MMKQGPKPERVLADKKNTLKVSVFSSLACLSGCVSLTRFPEYLPDVCFFLCNLVTDSILRLAWEPSRVTFADAYTRTL